MKYADITKFILVYLFSVNSACAGLPPTSSKISGDSKNIGTFNYQFPNFSGTHTGVTVSLGVDSVAGGGTGLATLTAHDVLVGNGTSNITLISPSTSGFVLTSNGTGSDPTFQAIPSSSGVTSNASSQRLDNVFFAGNAAGSTKCTASPCTISSQSGSWASSVTRNSAGNYTINAVGGEFSTVPVCTCTADIAAIAAVGVCEINFSTSTTTALNVFVNSSLTGSAEDAGVSVICQGTH